MRKFSKGVWVLLIALAGLFLIVLLGANLYVQSPGVQSKIEANLSHALKVPLRLTGASFTPWSGLRFTGIEIAQSEGTGRPAFMNAPAFAATFRLLPLLGRKLVIKKVTLEAPKIVWFQDAQGRWRLPELVEPALAQPKIAGERKEPVFAVSVLAFGIAHGNFEFYDAAGRPVAAFSDVNVDGHLSPEGTVEGKFLTERAGVQGHAVFHPLSGDFSYDPKSLEIKNVKAGVAGGDLEGGMELRTAEAGAPYSVQAKFDRVDLGTLIAESGGPADQAGGTLGGYLDIRGKVSRQKDLAGSGQIILQNGRIKQYDLFAVLGMFLHIEELSGNAPLQLKQAEADYHLAGTKVLVDKIVLASANLRLSGSGEVKMAPQIADSPLRFDSSLVLDDAVSRQLPAFILQAFHPGENPGEEAIEFPIRGTLSHPDPKNLSSRIQGQAASGLLGLFFGQKSKSKGGSPLQMIAPAAAGPAGVITPLSPGSSSALLPGLPGVALPAPPPARLPSPAGGTANIPSPSGAPPAPAAAASPAAP